MSQFFSEVTEKINIQSNFGRKMNEHRKNNIFETIANAAADLNQETYVIGGYVRDIYLERPSKDIDIVTLGSGSQLAENVAKRLKPRPQVAVFKNFGTAQLKHKKFEI